MTKNTGSFLLGLGIGLAIGILFAPDKGKNTREKLIFQLQNAFERLKEYINKLKSEEEQLANEGKHLARELVRETKEKAEGLLMDIEELMEKVKNQQ
ncbi:MAG: YtxH domain-containing protein [Bacteroidia bacterium]|nr:YtxH domain-containing protein [Bacteroidia bacterium]MDW8301989.1 YtxH domain-containing protein [Bacteroidia bacterium]